MIFPPRLPRGLPPAEKGREKRGAKKGICWPGEGGEGGRHACSPPQDAPVERFVYPWDLLDWQERVMVGMEGRGRDRRKGVYVTGALRVGQGTTVMPGVVVEGYVWAGDGCRIGPNCHLRGYVSLGNGCVVGQGVELKNCIIGDGTLIPHLSYAGDSIIGCDVNFGAGTVCSNFRHDGGEHRMMAGGRLEPAGRNKLGAVIGDHVRLGANTIVLPARVVPPGAWTMPGEVFTGA